MYRNTKETTNYAFINPKWRNFQNKPAVNENRKDSIFLDQDLNFFNKKGWCHTHLIQSPLSSAGFYPGREHRHCHTSVYLGTTSRYAVILLV